MTANIKPPHAPLPTPSPSLTPLSGQPRNSRFSATLQKATSTACRSSHSQRPIFTLPLLMDRDSELTFENGPESPCSGDDTKICSAPSPKKSRRDVQKRVVSVPIGEVEGSKSKGEAYPPSDSWAWRKYGQKPIKGSPYPRGYYRCSSSKGCPARKQVERSRMDPNMIVITYACDHNHPVPITKHHSSASTAASSSPVATSATTDSPAKLHPEELVVFANVHDLALGGDSSPLLDERFLWFTDVASTNVLESPICEAISSCSDGDVAMVFSMGEDEESLFADLGELPECSVVFRRSVVKPDEPNRRCNVSAVSCYDSTS